MVYSRDTTSAMAERVFLPVLTSDISVAVSGWMRGTNKERQTEVTDGGGRSGRQSKGIGNGREKLKCVSLIGWVGT